MIRLRGPAVVLSAAALVAAGCGSSSKSNTPPKPAGTAATSSKPATSGSSTASGGYTRQVDTAVAPLISAIQGARNNPLSASAWDQVSKTAGPAKDQVSVEEFVSAAVANRLASREYIESRARLFNREDLERALKEIPDVEPEEHDRL